MSNLVKQVYVIGNGDERIINSNENAERIIKAKNAPQQVFREGDLATMEFAEESDAFSQMEEVALPDASELLEQAQLQVEQMLEEAREQAEQILQDANAQAEETIENARRQGLAAGQEEAAKEKDAMLQNLQQDYEERNRLLEEEYQANRETMELELVEVLLPVFKNVIGVELERDKSIILHLCQKAILGMEADKHFIVRTSQENRTYLLEHQEEILGNLSGGVTVEFLSDSTMSDMSCVIETESGMVDCGADTQLENLATTIRKLSRD